MGGLAFGAARLMHFDARQVAGFALAVTFVNAGNYGLGVNCRPLAQKPKPAPSILSPAVFWFTL